MPKTAITAVYIRSQALRLNRLHGEKREALERVIEGLRAKLNIKNENEKKRKIKKKKLKKKPIKKKSRISEEDIISRRKKRTYRDKIKKKRKNEFIGKFKYFLKSFRRTLLLLPRDSIHESEEFKTLVKWEKDDAGEVYADAMGERSLSRTIRYMESFVKTINNREFRDRIRNALIALEDDGCTFYNDGMVFEKAGN